MAGVHHLGGSGHGDRDRLGATVEGDDAALRDRLHDSRRRAPGGRAVADHVVRVAGVHRLGRHRDGRVPVRVARTHGGIARCGRIAGADDGPGALPRSRRGNEDRLAVRRAGRRAERRANRAGRGRGEGAGAGRRPSQQEGRCPGEPGADLAEPSHQSHGSHVNAFAAGDLVDLRPRSASSSGGRGRAGHAGCGCPSWRRST